MTPSIYDLGLGHPLLTSPSTMPGRSPLPFHHVFSSRYNSFRMPPMLPASQRCSEQDDATFSNQWHYSLMQSTRCSQDSSNTITQKRQFFPFPVSSLAGIHIHGSYITVTRILPPSMSLSFQIEIVLINRFCNAIFFHNTLYEYNNQIKIPGTINFI